MVFLVDRAGLNNADGPTHYGVFDVAFLSEVPELRIYTPITRTALRNAMDEAFRADVACAIRYPNGCESARVVRAFYGDADPVNVSVRDNYPVGGPEMRETLDAVIVTHGRIVEEALAATDLLAADGVKVGILLLEQIKPYETVAAQVLARLPKKRCPILFLEEEIRAGGMGMLLSDAMRNAPEMQGRVLRIMALDKPLDYPSEAGQSCLKMAGLDAEHISGTLREVLECGK